MPNADFIQRDLQSGQSYTAPTGKTAKVRLFLTGTADPIIEVGSAELAAGERVLNDSARTLLATITVEPAS